MKNLSDIDDKIRRGELAAARAELRHAVGKPLPREQLATAASLAWRVKLGGEGMRLLNPIVRPAPRLITIPTPNESAVYAACLCQIGAVEEGLALLDAIDEKIVPQALLYRAAALISRWDYTKAIPVLQQYLAAVEGDAYQSLVAKVNLAAAYVYEQRLEPFSLLLAELGERTLEPGLRLLRASVLELGALSAVLSRDWAGAREALRLAGDSFFVRKWRAVASLLEHGPTPDALEELRLVRAAAESLAHWETVRDCDHFRAVACRNEKLFWRVYFGTPYDNFRAKILAHYGGGSPPMQFLWELVDKTAETTLSPAEMTPGTLNQRLLHALTADFYRPQRLAFLHSRLFPGDRFNPASSPARVRQAISRLRRWLASRRVNVFIVEKQGCYALSSEAPVGVWVYLEETPATPLEADLICLRRRFGGASFRMAEAKSVLNRPERTVRRVLDRAVSTGRLGKSGEKSGTRYRFVGE